MRCLRWAIRRRISAKRFPRNKLSKEMNHKDAQKTQRGEIERVLCWFWDIFYLEVPNQINSRFFLGCDAYGDH